MAPLSAAQRQRNRRAKLKNGENYDDYKAKQAAHMKQYRIEKKQSIENLPKEEKAKMKEDNEKKSIFISFHRFS